MAPTNRQDRGSNSRLAEKDARNVKHQVRISGMTVAIARLNRIAASEPQTNWTVRMLQPCPSET